MENVVPVIVIVVLIYLVTEGLCSLARNVFHREPTGQTAVLAACIVGVIVVLVSFFVSTLKPDEQKLAKDALVLFGSILGSLGLNDTIKGLMPPGKQV